MKIRKIIATALASATLLGTVVTTVSAAQLQLVKKCYVYNAKGRKTKSTLRKGKKVKTLGTKKIKGKKFYKIGKNKYILFKNVSKKVVKTVTSPTPTTPKPTVPEQPKQEWQSRHLVDTLPDINTQIAKALQLQGDDRLEAEKEIAAQLNILPDQITPSTQKAFEESLQAQLGARNSAKNWIEQGGR